MNNPSTAQFHILSHPISAALPLPQTPATAPEPAAAASSEAAGTAAGGGARRGRPTICSDKVLAMIKDFARRLGFSDTAAAEGAGVSSSTISRWKKEDPELAHELQQARQECRIHHLERIMAFAEGDNNRGLRASMWLLERLFPGDYAPRMAERFAHRHFEDRAREREEAALADERRREVLAEREARAAEAQEKHRALLAAYEAEIARPAGAAQPAESDPPAGVIPEDAEPAHRASASESASHNSRNEADAAPQDAPASLKAPGLQVLREVEGHPRPELLRDTEARNSGRGRPDSLEGAAPQLTSFAASESASHNSRNSGEAEEASLTQTCSPLLKAIPIIPETAPAAIER